MSKYQFSAKNNCFYLSSSKSSFGDKWPDDCVSVSDDIFNEFAITPKEGKQRIVKNDMPAWQDIPPPPPPSHDELAKQAQNKKKALMNKPKQEIIFYTGMIMMGDNGSQEELNKWRDFYKSVGEINTQKAPDIEWPIEPENQ